MEDAGKCEEAKQSTLNFKCQKQRDVTEAKRFASVLKLEDGVASSTPEKQNERLAIKSKVDEAFELPESYQSIVELFRQMSCSLRLLTLCKKSTTFGNVCTQVEILAKRKFSYKHLGQIKFILPEAVQIQKIIIHNEESQCMKPDLKITLAFDVVKDHGQKSDFIALCHLFFSRVVDFLCTHSEGCDIPEAALPLPSNQEKEFASSEAVLPDTSVGLSSSAVDIEPLKYSSLIASPTKQFSVENVAAQRMNSSPNTLRATYSSPGSSRACDSPLINYSSEASNLMVETPSQVTPKRALLETEENVVAISNKALTSSEKPAKRSLNFTFETADRYVLENTVGKTEHFMNSQHGTPQGAISKEYTTDRKANMNAEEDGGNSCTGLHGCVPVIHHIFHSVNYSPITKQELVFKILINSLDIVERGVVEEHLEQLELLLPNWISKRITPSGDLLYSINKLSEVSALLAELQS